MRLLRRMLFVLRGGFEEGGEWAEGMRERG
jgi:hypothetical protein